MIISQSRSTGGVSNDRLDGKVAMINGSGSRCKLKVESVKERRRAKSKKGGIMIKGDVMKCIGCLHCQMACSFVKHKEFNPSKSYVQLQYNRFNRVVGLVFTDDCDDCGVCIRRCPTEAIEIIQ